jgi:hypothetical protein
VTPRRAIRLEDDPRTPPPRSRRERARLPRRRAYRWGFALGQWLATVRWVLWGA